MVGLADAALLNTTNAFNVGGMAPAGAGTGWGSDLFANLQGSLGGLDLNGAMQQLMQNLQDIMQRFSSGEMNFGNLLNGISNPSGPGITAPTV